MTESDVARVARWVREADVVTALTGAGISTESGIPDFRGPAGVWTKDPAAARLFDFDAYVADPQVRVAVWQRRLEHAAWTARPNAGHRALVDLERSGRLLDIVTQNIDGLHQAAGSDPDRVLEVHGSLHTVVCLSCGRRTPMADTLARLEAGEEDPTCLRCGGILKSGTISFGQPLDPAVWRASVRAAAACDVLLVVGSSLQVHPVASLCEVAKDAGARLVILNAESTPYDRLADAVLAGPIGQVLPALVGSAATTRS
jgi:NAD-dependent deacetylase